MHTEVEGNRKYHPVFARVWAGLSPRLDDSGALELRRQLLDGLSGRVVEIGAGDGRNLPHYPLSVEEVLAIEPEPYLRGKAEEATDGSAVVVTVRDGIAEALPVEDDTFDHAVTSLVLCSVANLHASLAEIRRVLRSGGSLRFLEHVAADGTTHRGFQKALDATVWPHVAGGCHTSRDTVGAIEDAGFEVTRLERFRFPDSPPTPTSPHVLGEARWVSAVPVRREAASLERGVS